MSVAAAVTGLKALWHIDIDLKRVWYT